MKKLTTWILAGSLAAGAGCATVPPAKAQEPAAPVAPVAEQEALEAERAAVRAAGQDARRAESQARKAQAEVRARLRAAGGVNGNMARVYAREMRKEKAAYLGVTTSSVNGALREQMKLQRGFGLVVDTVEETSAAGEAGIQQFDILQKLNDQLLVNTQQLSVLIRSMKPGEKVTVTLLRAGQPTTVDVTLKEKELPVLGEASGGSWTLEAPLFEAHAALPALQRLELDPDGHTKLLNIFGDDEDEGSSIYSDSEMSLTITGEEDDRSLKAKDAQGTVLFNGPIATEEQKKALPEKVAEKLKKFESKLANIKTTNGKNVRVRIIEND
jgi:hypothetical protein